MKYERAFAIIPSIPTEYTKNMVWILLVARALAVAGMFYALHKERRDWVRILVVISALLTFIGYSLDGNWVFAVLQVVVMFIVLSRSLMKRKSD